MAELQTLTAALQLVSAVGETVLFFGKVARARQEASVLYRKVQRLERLSKRIKDFLESRVEDRSKGSSTPEERSIEKDIKDSLDECRRCLEEINHELRPLAQVPRGRISEIADRMKYVLNDKFIKGQEHQIESNFQSLSISFHLLQNYAHTANQRATKELIERNARLLVQIITEIHQLRPNFQSSSSDSFEPGRLQLRQELSQAVNDYLADHPGSEIKTGKEDGEEDGVEDTLQRDDASDDENSSELEAALRIAVKHNQDEIVRGLRQSVAITGIHDSEDMTLLHYAIHKNAEKALDALLDTEGQQLSLEWLDAQSKRGFTALMYNAYLADPDKSVTLARTLISRGCDVNVKDERGRSAICFAIEGGPSSERKDLVTLLLEHDAEAGPAFVWDKEQAKRFPDLHERFSASHQHGSSSPDENDDGD